jgi:hypothetical protein
VYDCSRFVLANPEEGRLPELAIARALLECNLDD